MTELRVVATRGDLVESAHRVSVAVAQGRAGAGAQGRRVAEAGDPELVTFWRSAAKPFQALPLVEDGAMTRFGLGSEELALACASHSSEQIHLDVTERFLSKIGCTEADLACGPHPPLGPEVASRVAKESLTVTSRWSNCSGKHSGMLALAKHHGWETKGYEKVGHPVQSRILRAVQEWTGCEARGRRDAEAQHLTSSRATTAPLRPRAPAIHFAVDGCMATCFGLPLSGMARAYAALGDGATPALATVRDAMLAHPELIAGTGRSCTDVMRAAPGKVIVKLGADGVYCGALVGTGLGFALKVEDGDMRTLPIALLAVLDQLAEHVGWSERWSVLTPRHGEYEIKNTRKVATGRVFAEGKLRFG
jgi:L-asparaginase II